MNTDNTQIFVCEECGKEHDGSYGSGRFCSAHCRRVWIGKQSNITMKKNGTKKCNFNKNKLNNGRSSYGTWKCKRCNLIFETRKLLEKHNHLFHPIPKGNSWNKGLTKETDERMLKRCKTYNLNFLAGKFLPSCKGKHHSEEHKKKTSKSLLKFRRTLNSTQPNINSFIPSYNKDSIQFLNKLSIEMNWNLLHAENGGEVICCGYFLDAYDKEKNIVVEYDELGHYKDVENNILVNEDIERQNVIIEHLHCLFYRYNEKTKVLWKVN